MVIYKPTQLDLNQKYQPKIKGLGEIYEQMSVFHLQQKLREKYQNGRLFLATNKNHTGRGLTLTQLKKFISSKYQILEVGYVDSPPWKSKISAGKVEKPNEFFIFLARIIFFILIRLEFLWQGKYKSHMIFCFCQK